MGEIDPSKTPSGKTKRAQRIRRKRSERREQRRNDFDKKGWERLDGWHWRKIVDGRPLVYAPSTKRFTYCGKTYRGDPIKFIEELLK